MFVCLCVCHFSVVCSCLLCVISEEHLALVKRLVEVFDRALEQITKLLTFDSLPRFLRSPEFQQFCETFNDAHQQKQPGIHQRRKACSARQPVGLPQRQTTPPVGDRREDERHSGELQKGEEALGPGSRHSRCAKCIGRESFVIVKQVFR